MALLKVSGLTKNFGGLCAVSNVNMEINEQELIGLIAADADSGELWLDLIMVAKYLERIGDHATNVAEWVEYSITGNHPSNN